MKNIILLFVVSLFTFTACNKKEQPHTHFVTAKIGNYTFYASGNYVSSQKNTTNPNLYIEAFTPTGNTIKISLNNFTGGLDSFSLDGINSAASYLGPTPSIEQPAIHGKLYILTVTPDITGTFNFTTADATVVDGSFNIAP